MNETNDTKVHTRMPRTPERAQFDEWAGKITAKALDKAHANIEGKISEKLYQAYKIGRRREREANAARIAGPNGDVINGRAIEIVNAVRESGVDRDGAIRRVALLIDGGFVPRSAAMTVASEAERSLLEELCAALGWSLVPREDAIARVRELREKQPAPTWKEDAMHLGALIEELKKHDRKAYVQVDRSPVGLVPAGVESYRGYYEDLSITVNADGHGMNNGALIELLEKSIGSTITGYKGGDYLVAADTRVWISNHGEASGSLVTGVRFAEWGCVFIKWRNDDEEG